MCAHVCVMKVGYLGIGELDVSAVEKITPWLLRGKQGVRVRVLSLTGHGLKPQCKNILGLSPVRTGQDQLSHLLLAFSSPFHGPNFPSFSCFFFFNFCLLDKLSLPACFLSPDSPGQVRQWLFALLLLNLFL